MKADLLAEHDQQLEVVQAARRLTRHPRAADVNHEAASVRQDALELLTEGPEPIDVA